jgi:hypothetical protein
MFGNNPYLEALQWIRRHPGTSGGAGLAKLTLSLYNSMCGYSFAECISGLDSNLTTLALRMVNHYATHGETQELCDAGKEIADVLYPGLWQMAIAMRDSRDHVRAQWEREAREQEAAEIQAEEVKLRNGDLPRVPLNDAMSMLEYAGDQIHVYYHQFGRWCETTLSKEVVRNAISENGTSLTGICPESSFMLSVHVEDKTYYVSTDYDARDRYLASLNA